jgi:U3 small nucleolar RNA-associated protein 7
MESEIASEKDGTKEAAVVAKYKRGAKTSLKGIVNKKVKRQLVEKEVLFEEAAVTASKVEQWLLPSEGGYLEAEGLEDTRHFSQESIVKEVDVTSARKAFDLSLPDLGPYVQDYNRSGRYLVLAGRKGHLAIMDWKQARLIMELQVAFHLP